MKLSERKRHIRILRTAAERIEVGASNYCCDAIVKEDTRDIFTQLFKADAEILHPDCKDAFVEESSEKYFMTKVRARRILLLLWCAEMVRIGFFK